MVGVPLIITADGRGLINFWLSNIVFGAILVQAAVNGDGPFWVMLNTGDDPSIVELGTAKSIGLKIAANGQQESGGGASVMLDYRHGQITLAVP